MSFYVHLCPQASVTTDKIPSLYEFCLRKICTKESVLYTYNPDATF